MEVKDVVRISVVPVTSFAGQFGAGEWRQRPPFLHKPGLSPLQQLVDRVVGERVGIVAIGMASTKVTELVT